MRTPALTTCAALVALVTAVGRAEPPAPSDAPAAQPATDRPRWPQRQIVQGMVQDAAGARVGGAIVVLFDADTGEVYSSVTDNPFGDPQWSGEPPPVAYDVSGGDGRFHVRGLFPGNYRALAFSWDGVTPSAPDPGDLGSTAMTLHGVAEGVAVEEGREPDSVSIKPAGTATVTLHVAGGSMLLVSTKPLTGDLLLGIGAIKGEFLRNLVAAIHASGTEVTLRGMPAGPLHCVALGNSRNFAAGTAGVVAKAGETVEARVEMVRSTDGERPLPAALVPLAEEPRDDVQAAVAAALGPDFKPTPGQFAIWDLPLEREVVLPSGRRTTIRDLVTVERYKDFNREARSHIEKRQPPPAASAADGAAKPGAK